MLALTSTWVALRLRPGEAVDSLRNLHAAQGLLAVCAMLSSAAFASIRWRMLLGDGDLARPTAVEAFRTLLEAGFVGLLPTGLAGDVLRASRVGSTDGRTTAVVWLLVYERVVGLVGLALVASASIVAKHLAADVGVTSSEIALAAPGAVALLIVLGSYAAPAPGGGEGSAVARLWRRPARYIALSVGTQGCVVVAITTLLRGTAPGASIADLLVRAPVVILATFVPVTPAGVGQRELVFVSVFETAGVSAEAAVAASLAWFASGLVGAAVGGVSLWLRLWKDRNAR